VRAQLASEHYLSFNPGLILGGTALNYDKTRSQGAALGKSNVIAKVAMAKGDLRFITTEQKTMPRKKYLPLLTHTYLAQEHLSHFKMEFLPCRLPQLI
jgi:glutamate carboxypeptidase